MIPSNYVCDGQLNIWDYLGTIEEVCESEENLQESEVNLSVHEIDDSICEGCKWREWESRKLEVNEHGHTWVYGCPGTACANWKHGTPLNLTCEKPDHKEVVWYEEEDKPHCYNRDFLPDLPLIIEWVEESFKLGLTATKCDWDDSIEIIYKKMLSRGLLEIYDDKYSGTNKRFVSLDYQSSREGFGRPCDNIEDIFRGIKQALERDEKIKHQKKEKADPYA